MFTRSAKRQYDRTQRIQFEIAILVSSAVTFACSVAYGVMLWNEAGDYFDAGAEKKFGYLAPSRE